MFMPVRYDQDTKAKPIQLVREHAGDYPSEYTAITAAVDEGQAQGLSSEAAKEIRELKRKVGELERATASARPTRGDPPVAVPLWAKPGNPSRTP